MWSESLCRLGSVLCLLSMAACQQPVPTAAPPADSYRVDNFTLASDGNTQTVRGASVTPAFFQSVLTPPFLGRLFAPEEYKSGRAPLVVLHHRFWAQRFKSDPTAIGKALQLNGKDFTIVGVMPPTFDLPSGVDLWVPQPDSRN
jgi:MacB-like periplasmic core domain